MTNSMQSFSPHLLLYSRFSSNSEADASELLEMYYNSGKTIYSDYLQIQFTIIHHAYIMVNHMTP